MSPWKSEYATADVYETNNAQSLVIQRKIIICSISPRTPGFLSVLRVSTLASTIGGAHMPDTPKLNIREWLVPPVLLPIFFALLIAGAVIIQW